MRRRLGGALGILLVASVVALGAAPSGGATNLAAPLRLRRIAAGLSSPVALAWRANNAGMIYVAQQTGDVTAVKGGLRLGTVLHVNTVSGGEQGLLGLVFSHDGSKIYVDYTLPTGDIQIDEYKMKNADEADATSRRPLLTIPHSTYANHNGGNLVMGSGGMLYIGVGDGGGGGDSLHNGQNKNSLLAKILRIDPRPSGGNPYTIPPSNPFVGVANTQPETWMWGLRNPWRFSFDRQTHDMWIGDVGQGLYEEVDYAKAGEKGINWGWPDREGFHAYNGPATPGERNPIIERPHSAGDCAIVGGYVYRGKVLKGFQGAYVFGDACTGELRAITQVNGKVAARRDLHLNVPQLSSLGEGPGGEIFALSLHGELYRIDNK